MSKRRTSALLAVVAALVAAGAVGALAHGRSAGSASGYNASIQHSKFQKSGDPDAVKQNQDRVGSGNEPDMGPLSAAEEKAADNAYPAQQIAPAQTDHAQKVGKADRGRGPIGRNRPGTWTPLGPTRAQVPGVLAGAFAPSVIGQDYVASGRVTALAVSPRCDQGRCRLWLGAAGGGVWRTDRALDTHNLGWQRVSDGLGSNAVGTIAVDPTDPTGNTLYLGTGEPNASADSEAGVGLYKSTDGGDHWSLIPSSQAIAQTRAISSVVVDPTNPSTIYLGTTRAVRGVSSVSGGATTGTGAPQPELGLYKSTDGGATWTVAWHVTVADANSPGSIRGVSHIALDPSDPSTVYASAYQRGIYRSVAGGPFQQVFAGQNPGQNTDRTMFAVTTKDGKTRIYAVNGSLGTGSSANYSAFFRVDDASLLVDGSPNAGTWQKLTSNVNGDPYYATFDFCTGQCWYDMNVVTPKGQPDTVFVIGSYTYGEAGFRSNARAVLRSTTAGDPDPANGDRTFTDLTYDSHSPAFGTHPDEHAIAIDPENPGIYFEGSDGGVIRSSGDYSDVSSQCDGRPLGAASMLTCHRLLSAVPTTLYSLNEGLDTLQFQSLSDSLASAKQPAGPKGGSRPGPGAAVQLQGGTQDNGTWLGNGGGSVPSTWNQTIYGDGGQSGYNVSDPSIRFNTFFDQATDENFESGDPTKWVITSGPLFGSGERAPFYMAIIADPKAPGTQFAGLQHVFRTTDNGGDKTFLEANCQEFTTSAAEPSCGDWQPIGQKLTDPASGDKAGGTVAAVERATSDTSTLWAATSTGRVFVSKNADAADPSTVTFARIDTSAEPNRFVSSITIDGSSPNHAFVSYGGYNTTTGSTAPGHVYEVSLDPITGTATWTDRSYDLGDLPIDDLVRDDVTGDLYASNDFGVFRLASGTTSWTSAADGLPAVEVPGLTIVPSTRKLYAATHGLGAWSLDLP